MVSDLQLFVGGGFRRMAESFDRVLDSPIQLDFGIPRYRHHWQDQLMRPTDPPQPIY